MKSREDLGKAMEQIQTSEKIRRDKLEREQRIEKQKLARQQRDTEDKLKRWSEQELDRREKSPQKPRKRDKGREAARPSSKPVKPVRDDPAASRPVKNPWERDVLSSDKERKGALADQPCQALQGVSEIQFYRTGRTETDPLGKSAKNQPEQRSRGRS